MNWYRPNPMAATKTTAPATAARSDQVSWQDHDGSAAFLVLHFDFMLYDVIVFGRVLLLKSYLLNRFYVLDCASVEDWKFRCIHFNQTVVYPGGIQRCHGMFDGTYTHVAVGYHRTPAGLYHVFGQSRNHYGGILVHPHELYSLSCLGRFENGFYVKPRM